MKVVILAGGYGTRLAEETGSTPKPMIQIGGRPMLWHIMRHYAHHGFNEFVIACGYKGDVIKRYFLDYHQISGDLTVELGTGRVEVRHGAVDDWRVHVVDTGLDTMTGGRVRRIQPLLADGAFMLTYGDGVSDVDLTKLLEFHRAQGRLATVTAVRPPSRFGGLTLEGDAVVDFTEKPQIGEGWINGGFMVLEPGIFRYLASDRDSLEIQLLERVASARQLAAFRHEAFWQCMDTPRDMQLLERLWHEGAPPWRTWA